MNMSLYCNLNPSHKKQGKIYVGTFNNFIMKNPGEGGYCIVYSFVNPRLNLRKVTKMNKSAIGRLKISKSYKKWIKKNTEKVANLKLAHILTINPSEQAA